MVYLKNEERSSQVDRHDAQENPGQNKGKNQAKRVGGWIACVPGVLLGLGGIVGALLGATEDISAGGLAIVLGVVGYSLDRKSTRLNSSHANISYAVFCLRKTTSRYRSA